MYLYQRLIPATAWCATIATKTLCASRFSELAVPIHGTCNSGLPVARHTTWHPLGGRLHSHRRCPFAGTPYSWPSLDQAEAVALALTAHDCRLRESNSVRQGTTSTGASVASESLFPFMTTKSKYCGSPSTRETYSVRSTCDIGSPLDWRTASARCV